MGKRIKIFVSEFQRRNKMPVFDKVFPFTDLTGNKILKGFFLPFSAEPAPTLCRQI